MFRPSAQSLTLFAIAIIAANVRAKEIKQVRQVESGGQFVGAIGCKSSSCHGGAGPKREQYTIWSQRDFHSRAFVILLDARSARIAEALGPTPAQSNARCTVCHSPFQTLASNQLMPGAHVDEGVSCETCHGAAGGWLRGHTRPDWTYATRVGAGMHDLRNLYVRANACVACHQNISLDLVRAGHPALVFELDSQSNNQPKHWQENDPWIGPHSWLTGQAVALREMSWALSQETKPDENEIARYNGLAWLLMRTCEAMPSLATDSGALNAYMTAQSAADALARRAPKFDWSDSSVRELLLALASTDTEFGAGSESRNVLAQRGKRLVLALDRLSSALNANSGTKSTSDAQMNALFQDVQVLDNFDVAAFAGHLRALRLALTQTAR